MVGDWFAEGHAPEIIDKLNSEINAILADSQVKARLADLGSAMFAGSSADFEKFVANETEKWGKSVEVFRRQGRVIREFPTGVSRRPFGEGYSRCVAAAKPLHFEHRRDDTHVIVGSLPDRGRRATGNSMGCGCCGRYPRSPSSPTPPSGDRPAARSMQRWTLMMYSQSVTHREEGWVFPVAQQHPRPLDPARRLVRDRVIATNLATSSSPIDNSIACRHAVTTFNSVLANRKPGYKPSRIT